MTNNEQGRRPRGRKERVAWYAAALERQAGSGLSVAAYAARIGVTAATLYQWKKRLVEQAENSVEVNSAQSNGLIRVAVPNCPSAQAPEKFLVHLSSSRSIEVPQDFNTAALERLLGIVQAC